MPEDPHVDIGRLRWTLYLVQREQAALIGRTDITETLVTLKTLRADVQAVGSLTFWSTGGYEQVDRPVTHRIFCRWTDYLDQTLALIRSTLRPTDGTTRIETFRVRRIKELGGRKRFVLIEAELEKVT